eukprot:COSAG01_NODE_489_length_16370_cov_7.973818_11_plen_84_part_00
MALARSIYVPVHVRTGTAVPVPLPYEFSTGTVPVQLYRYRYRYQLYRYECAGRSEAGCLLLAVMIKFFWLAAAIRSIRVRVPR